MSWLQDLYYGLVFILSTFDGIIIQFIKIVRLWYLNISEPRHLLKAPVLK